MRILIVDDSYAMQAIVRRGIERMGFSDIEIQYANNGSQALDITRSWEPNLILTDWHMPEMDGMELLQSLNRQMLETQIGFITTEKSPKRQEQAIAAGAKFLIKKPFDYKTLDEAVRPLILSHSKNDADTDNSIEAGLPIAIKLPNVELIASMLNNFIQADLDVVDTDCLQLKQENFPSLVSLFENTATNNVSAIAILDFYAVCIVGNGVSSNEYGSDFFKKTIVTREIPDSILNYCRKIMNDLSVVLYDEKTLDPLFLKKTKLIRRNSESITRLLKKTKEKRMDIEINVNQVDMQGLNKGLLSIFLT